MYEHYLYTEDLSFLKNRAMPVMKKSVRFFEDYLYRDDDGHLLTGPSLSPENTYRSHTGQKGALCMAPTMDSTILRQLFTAYLHGLEILGEKEPEVKNKIQQMLDALPPISISKDGRIMEWYQDFEETEPGHRHISHLYGLHPGNEIIRENKELFEAAAKTLEYRLSHGGGHTGWSKAWIICFYARLGNGSRVYRNVIEMLQKCIQDNLLDVHPPFQIDGNFGFAEAILECIVQSHAGYIDLLPALPDEWETGFIKGIRLRGAMSADISWENKALKECTIYCHHVAKGKPKDIIVRYGNSRKSFLLTKGKPLVINQDMLK
jgi:alpha-L-fucosidase 2